MIDTSRQRYVTEHEMINEVKSKGIYMAQSKSPDNKGHAHGAGWKEQQHKYTQTAKELFEKFSDHAKTKPDHTNVMEHHKKNLESINHAHKMTKDMFEKISDHAKTSKPDHAKIMEHHKKNLESINHAHKMTAEVLKSLASMHGDFVKKTFEDMNAMMRGAMTQKPGQPIDLSAHSDVMKNSLHRAAEHAKSMGSVLSSSSKEIHTKVKDRLDEAKEEIKTHAAKHSKH